MSAILTSTTASTMDSPGTTPEILQPQFDTDTIDNDMHEDPDLEQLSHSSTKNSLRYWIITLIKIIGIMIL